MPGRVSRIAQYPQIWRRIDYCERRRLMSSEMTETDIGVIFVGTNDVSSCTPRNNRSAKQLPKLITQFVQTNKHTQWIIVPILHRHDLHWRNYLNYQINLINSKLKKLYGTWVVDIKDFGRRFFTNHGLHLNKYGKIEISRRISHCALQNTKVNSSTQSEPRDIATSQPINEYLPVLREIPKLSNRVTNSMMSSTPASAPLRMDNGTTLPSPPVSMQQYDTYSDALKTTCNSSHAAATEPSAISTATGDFNINVLNRGCSKTRKFRDLLASFNLGWLVNSPTRVFGGSQTAIDNVVTDIPGRSCPL
ncbi:hypothetical protein J6590_018762 [Homalodisca vitripennis]|nr:hypothetical protein J6590_018762 [Homalodisca vitripennis]